MANPVGLYIDPFTANVGIGTKTAMDKLHVVGGARIDGDLLPGSCNVYDLGSSNLRWRDLYLSGDTIDLGGTVLTRDTVSGGLNIKDRDTGSNVPLVTNTITPGENNTVEVVGDMNVTGTVYGGTQMFRNRVINGDMRIDQRNAGNAGVEYGPDRFKVIGTQNPMGVLPQQVTLSATDQATTGQVYATSLTSVVGPTSGLVSYLSFDGSNVTDVMGSFTTPTITGSVQYVPGVVPNRSVSATAAYFANEANLVATNTAANNYLTYICPALLTFTVSCWINMTKAPLSGNLSTPFTFGTTSTASYTLFTEIAYGSAGYGQLHIGYAGITPTAYCNIPINTWNHISIVYVPGSYYSLYLNGNLVGTTSSGSIPALVAGAGIIFGDFVRGYGTKYPFAGYIDDFRIYNRALTSGEIALLAGASPAITSMPGTNVADPGLAAYYPFEDSLAEASGAAGAPTLTGTGSGISYVTGANGNASGAIKLANDANVTGGTAAANYITATYTFPSAFTVSMWIYPTAIHASNMSIVFNTNINNASLLNALGLYVTSTYVALTIDNIGSSVFYSGNQISKWLHVALVHKSGISTLYLNGASASPISGNFAQSGGFILGNSGKTQAGKAYSGLIDDLRIYNRVLNAGEIAYLAGNGAYPSINNLNTTLNRAAHFPFDGSLTDVSGNSVALTTTGTVSYVPGMVGSQALYLANEGVISAGSGTPNYLSSTALTINSTTPWSVSLWFMYTRFTSSASVMFFFPSSISLYVYANKLGTDYAGVSSVSGTTTLTIGVWYHAVLTCTGTTSVIYLNGNKEGSNTGTAATSSGFKIGNPTATTTFAGYIDDFRIYNTVLTQSQVSALYYGSIHSATPQTNLLNYTPVSSVVYQQTIEGNQVADLAFGDASMITNPVVHYRFDGNLSDASGNGNVLTTGGSMSYVAGVKGQALYLANEANVTAGTAAANYVTSTYTFPSSFSVSLWVNVSALSSTNNNVIFITNNGSTDLTNSVCVYFHTSGVIRIAFTNTSNNTGTAGTYLNIWTHLVMMYSNGTLYLYINGIQQKSITGTLAQSGFMLGNVGTSTTQAFSGSIDEFRIYNTTLTQSQITALYTNSPLSSSPSPVTISCWLKNNTLASQQFSLALHNNYNRSAVYTIPAISAGAWRRVSLTLPGDTLGYWAKDTSAGMVLAVALGANSNVQTANVAMASGNTIGVWSSNLAYSGSGVQTYGASGAFLSAPGNSVYVTGVQVEKGSLATQFERRPFSVEYAANALNMNSVIQKKFISFPISLTVPITTTSTTPVSSGFSITITPLKTTSKILIQFESIAYLGNAGVALKTAVYRNNVITITSGETAFMISNAAWWGPMRTVVYDSPNTTLPVTYTIYFWSSNGTVVRLCDNTTYAHLEATEIIEASS